MWEISLIVQAKNAKYLEIIENKIKSLTKFKVHSALHNNAGSSTLSLATEKPEIELINLLKILIAEAIIFIEKEDLIKKKVDFKNTQQIGVGAFIKALVLFDFEADKNEIICSLELNKTIDLHAFFNFRLRALKKKWLELLNLVNQNNGLIGGADILLEMLVENLSFSDKNIFIEKSCDEFVLLDEEGKKIQEGISGIIFDEIELVTNLIILAPKKIKILCKSDISKETMNLIGYIFGNRVK